MEDFSISYTDYTKKGQCTSYQCNPTVVTTEWMKFMLRACGEQYMQAFMKIRERGLKERESRYISAGKAIEEYKKQTKDILAEMSMPQEETEITE